MKKYTDIKVAVSDLRKLTEIYRYCKKKKERMNSLMVGPSSSFDERCESYVYRLALNEMQKTIRAIKHNIKELDRESTRRDVERVALMMNQNKL